MADEALECFTSLLESVPRWIADLETTLRTAKERQQELRAADQLSRRASIMKRRASRSSSMNSKRSKDDQSAKEGNSLRRQLRDWTNTDVFRLSRRIQKSPSVISGDQSGPTKACAKAAGAIYYDSSVQQEFENIVRAVGSSRNAIRKGKMSVKVDALSRTGSSSSEDSEAEDFSPIMSNFNYKSTQPRSRSITAFAFDDGTAAFDRLNNELDKAQALTERAAHQVLRDGDCTSEVNSAKEHFAAALKIIEAEIPSLRKRADKAVARRRRSAERRRVDEEAQQRLREASGTLSPPDFHNLVVPAFPSEASLEVDELEVDDAGDDSEEDMPEVNISALPLGKYTQYRYTRTSPGVC